MWSFTPGERLPSVGGELFTLLGFFLDAGSETTRSLTDVIHPEDLDQVLQRFAELCPARTPSFDLDFRAVDSQGETHWFHTVGSLYRADDDTPERYLGTFTDVSDLRRALDALAAARVRAAEADKMRALGQLASGIAHDFNNTLAGVVWNCELITEDPATPEDIRNTLRLVIEAAMRSATTIKQLQRFATAPEAEQSPNLRANLSELVRSARELTRHRWQGEASARGATIEVVVEAQPNVEARIAPSEAQDILVNLILNAADAVSERGRIVLRVQARGDEAIVAVEDDGEGMDPETAQRCFEPFLSTKGSRGAGLGLFSAWATARRRHGKLEVSSVRGQGSVFTLALPLADSSATPVESAGHDAASARRAIAVVDDDPILRASLVKLLERGGASARGFEGGQALLDAFERGESFDVVITDLGMPEMDGRALAARLSRMRPTLPIILLTGWGDRLNAEEERAHGIHAVLSKPASIDDVQRCIARLLVEQPPT